MKLINSSILTMASASCTTWLDTPGSASEIRNFATLTFRNWRERNGEKFKHLPKPLAQQWMHRHWCDPVASFIPIEDLTCRENNWPPYDFVTIIGTVRGKDALDSGHWDFPLVVLGTPDGFIDCIEDHIEARIFLGRGCQAPPLRKCTSASRGFTGGPKCLRPKLDKPTLNRADRTALSMRNWAASVLRSSSRYDHRIAVNKGYR